MTGWALIGTGQQVQHEVAPAVAADEEARLIALVGTSTAKAEAAAAGFPGSYGTDSLRRVLEDPAVDVVYVGSPNGLHRDHVGAALTAGKHVLCDKPLAIRSRQAAELVAMARAAGLRLGLVHQLRYQPAHLRAREIIRAGEIGEPLSVSIDYASPNRLAGWRADTARAGGGVVFNVGVHLVDLVRFLSDAEVTHVAASAELDRDSGLDVSMSALLTMTSSASAFLWCSHRGSVGSRTLAVNGTEGSLVVRDSLRLTGVAQASSLTRVSTLAGVKEYAFPATNIMGAQVAAFDRAVTTGCEPDPGGVDGLAGVLVAEALMESVGKSSLRAVAEPDSVLP